MSNEALPSGPTGSVNVMLGRGSSSPVFPDNAFGAMYSDLFLGKDEGAVIAVGRIVNFYPKQGVVIVQSGRKNTTRCQIPSGQSHYVYGPKESWAPGLGEFVIFGILSGTDVGFILCSLPYVYDNQMPKMSPLLKKEKSLSKESEEILDAKTFGEEEFAVENCANNRTKIYDMASGERYLINDNLVGYMLNDFFFRIQSGELCRATFHYMDQLFEAFFHNLKIWNSGFYLESMCDYGRTNTEFHICPHLHDHAQQPDKNRRKAATIRLAGGWLDCGYSIYTQHAWEEKKPGNNMWFDEYGFMSHKSLASCSMMKVDGIFVPQREFQSDHHDKGETNFEIDKFEPRVPFDWEKADAILDVAFGCMARDYMAWQTAGKYRFIRYEPYDKDWEQVKTESNGPLGIGEHWGNLGGATMLTPQYIERSGDTNRYRIGEAFCGILPDGSVLLRDAWGTEVMLRGGRLILTSAIDVEVVAGTSFTVVAGRDICMKAEQHCEMIAIKKQMRFRSGMMMEIESKKEGIQLTTAYDDDEKGGDAKSLEAEGEDYKSPGVTIKSKSIHLISKNNTQIVSEKSISLQGLKEEEDQPRISMRCKDMRVWSMKKSIRVWLGEEKSNNLIKIDDKEILFSGDIWAQGKLTSIGDIMTDGNITTLDGNITAAKHIVGKSVAPNPSIKLEPITKSTRQSTIEGLAEDFVIRSWDDTQLRMPYQDSEDLMLIQYKHRTTSQFKMESGRVWWFEQHWQRFYRDGLTEIEFEDDLDKSKENSYPGKEHIHTSGGSLKRNAIYKDANVHPGGNPKNPDEMDHKGGEFTIEYFSNRRYKK